MQTWRHFQSNRQIFDATDVQCGGRCGELQVICTVLQKVHRLQSNGNGSQGWCNCWLSTSVRKIHIKSDARRTPSDQIGMLRRSTISLFTKLLGLLGRTEGCATVVCHRFSCNFWIQIGVAFAFIEHLLRYDHPSNGNGIFAWSRTTLWTRKN